MVKKNPYAPYSKLSIYIIISPNFKSITVLFHKFFFLIRWLILKLFYNVLLSSPFGDMVNIISLGLAGVMKQPNFGIQGAFEEDVI